MFFGFVVLFDDILVIVKVVVFLFDDVGVVVIKVGVKVVGVVIDDVVVILFYVVNFIFDWELLIIVKIVKGSLLNKLVILIGVLLFS